MEPIPFDKRSGKIWFNGEPVNWNDVKIHVLSHGLHYASCVFEGERVYDGEIFKLEEHTKRLFHSASRLDFKIPYSQESVNKFSKDIVAIQKIKNGYVPPADSKYTKPRMRSRFKSDPALGERKCYICEKTFIKSGRFDVFCHDCKRTGRVT